MKFKIGQTAWCLIHGRCIIVQTKPTLIARTTTQITEEIYYTPDGRLRANTNQVLFHYPVQPVAFLKRDSLVCEKETRKVYHVNKLLPNGTVEVYDFGCSSQTAERDGATNKVKALLILEEFDIVDPIDYSKD